MSSRILTVLAIVVFAGAPACKKDAAPAAPGAMPAAAPSAPAAKAGSAQAPAPAASGGVAARYAGKEISMAELDKEVAAQIHELRAEALEKRILKDLVGMEAKKAGKEERAFLQGIAEKVQAKPTEAEAKKFYEDNKARLEGQSFEQVKGMIDVQLQQEKQRRVIGEYLSQLKKQSNVQILLPAPRIEVKAEGPSKGPANAPVTIVEFSDFECPFCSRGKKTVDEVMEAYKGKVRLVFRDYPLPFHKKAQKASEAGLCAEEQGKFWEMHDKMFDEQKLDLADLKATAKALGVDAAKFDACLDSGKFEGKVKANMEAGQAAGVNGTPAFFINGRLLSGAQPFDKFKEIMDQELAAK